MTVLQKSEPTILKYMKDTLLFKHSSKVCAILRNENIINPEEVGIVLEESIMHPQGGGQESDKGTLTFIKDTDDKMDSFSVPVTRLEYNRENGILTHWITTRQEFLDIRNGYKVEIEIDGEHRVKNAKLHSAGHLIDVVASKLKPTWVPTKGMHFQSNSWVEFKGSIDPTEKDSFKTQFQAEIDSLLSQDLELIVSMVEGERRKVAFNGYNHCECGGTHVRRSGDLSGLNIEKIQKSKDCVKIKYSII